MPSPADENALQSLADVVRRRRLELDLNKIDVAKSAKITIKTYMKIEDGQPLRDVTYGKIEKALGWAPGSTQEVLRGRRPTVVEHLADGVVVSPVGEEELEADVAQAVTNAAIAVADTLSASDIRKLKQAVIEELRRSGRLPKRDE
ncbi:helix-turn-helix domain-containing protein [Streptomyces noursei]|uniref:helix-turn-helix domain-containing protein n=1 Tax=Streptomyces noursei TaxID=1971 RepID=UPI00380D3A07